MIRRKERVMARDRVEMAKEMYRAFAAGEREVVEGLIGEPFEFHSPADEQGLDRAGWFERCWPGSGSLTEFEFVRAIEEGDEVVVTYEATRKDGSRFRNTEVLTFDGDKQVRAEVYFGWNL
jgi:predicted SnoaL-like aldol condensation-catalyzing enzyme